jgi:TRAP-type C4-dicarboxylate transport system permease small subunit
MAKINEKEIQKKWWTSKTLWASVIVVIMGVLNWTQGQIEAGLPITLTGVLMAILRVITNKKLVK